LANILGLVDRLGEACECPEAARKLRAGFEARIEAVRRRTEAAKARPKVLISVDRVLGGGLRSVYAAGDDGYFTALLDIAGGRNACSGTGIAFPMLSPESVVELNPDVIVDLCVGAVDKGISKEDLAADWSSLKTVGAVKSGRVYVLTESFATVPGPRSIEFLEQLAAFLHPSLAEGKP
jgi:iron complex transport system substrate-binding protein